MDKIVYCDESAHLENDNISHMCIGALTIKEEDKKELLNKIKKLKEKHDIGRNTEVKWSKVSNNKVNFYLELIDLFFDEPINYRCIIVDKRKMNHIKFEQTHEEFYYKIYYELLEKLINNKDNIKIYLDIKDTKSSKRVQTLYECLSNNIKDFKKEKIKRLQVMNSKESVFIQLVDILTGATNHANRSDLPTRNNAKQKIIQRIKEKNGYDMQHTTKLREKKLNLFFINLDE